MYAIWFLFEASDETYLCKILSNLAKKYSAIQFVPHITVYGLIDYPLDYINEIVVQSIKNKKPFHVRTSNISYSNNFWKTVFVEFENNYSLNYVNKNLEKNFKANYDFAPHSSLIYKKMKLSEKIEITQSLKIKESLLIDRIGILKFSDDISSWHLVRQHLI